MQGRPRRAFCQATIGVAFTVLILGRIVTVLPRIDSVIKYSPDE